MAETTNQSAKDATNLDEVHPVRISVTEPHNFQSKQSICWINMMSGDMICNLELFSASVVAWRRLNPTLTYQNLEDELRKRGANTHIIARENNGPTPFKLGHIGNNNDPTVYNYYPIISCRFRTAALEELLRHHVSYNDNYAKLGKTGDIIGSVGYDNYENIESIDFTRISQDDFVRAIATNSIVVKCYI